MLPMLPVLLATGIGAALFLKKPKGMTPARQQVYQSALDGERDPNKLRALAASFRAEGLNDEATMLEKRARLRELPDSIKEARREAFKMAMNSKDKAGVLNMARAYRTEGATGAAEKLEEYAQGLQ